MTDAAARIAFAAAFLSACGASALAEDGEWLKKEIAKAKSGAVITVPPGVYDLADIKLYRSIALKGSADGKTVLRSASVTDKGILVPLAGVDLKVENITFEGARSWDRNGAGIRHEGRNLTVINCRFISNEDGILATGEAGGVVTITNSSFLDNGFGDGLSHGIYLSSGAVLNIDKSRFEGTRIGHHVKSLAGETTVRNTILDDGVGRGSYAVDASNGGALILEGNTFVQAKNAENYTIVNFDTSRGGKAASLVISGNKIVNRYPGGVFLRNDTKIAPTMDRNEIVNEGGKPIALLSPGSPKPAATIRN